MQTLTLEKPEIDGQEIEGNVLMLYRVFDCSENQRTCPNLVGLTFLHWPPAALTVEIVRIPLD